MGFSTFKSLTLNITSLIITCCAANAGTPHAGSAQRKAILNSLRPAIEAQIGPNVEFVVVKLNVAGNWAFVQAEPKRKDGKPIIVSNYFRQSELNMMDGATVTALLQYRYNHWNVIDKAIGATDAWYCGFPAAYVATHCR